MNPKVMKDLLQMLSDNAANEEPEDLAPKGSESEMDQSDNPDAVAEDEEDEEDTGEMVKGDELEHPKETAYWEVMCKSGQQA
ncbi:hypothetical protein BT96DRAFT_1007132 [Gymnopus androsaceus JB14]|uniref:Uncharacterized protein n=1 Tax=Gymnopus androsaceus JB14 TaxID=1447944 RepID=A0A6A4GIE6_9AGAR|nr:hypothetical protein BT96DRAFT_1007132 [Gymnopus androsaceus JB14]